MSQVVTRFAPSPTGFLHIGGARTALFNWLYAKRFGGKFLLRIEDTDRERSTDGGGRGDPRRARLARARPGTARRSASSSAPTAIARSSSRCSPRAAPIAATPRQEELEEMRDKARAEGKPMRYDGRWRDRDPSEAPAGVEPAIRLRARQDGETIVDDKVQGKVVFANKELDDLVLLRSDGNPTYMLAVVVDDHDMGVTHIIRGDDHLTNAARQMQIYDALGWDVPIMAHIPLIHGPDGAKLSKRHGALGVDAYRAHGLSARGAAQLSRAARLEPGRPRVLLDRGDDRRLRPAGDRPLAVALRLRQAREHERPFHARDARRRADGDPGRRPALSARRPGDRRRARRRQARPAPAPPCPASRSAPRRWSSSSTAPAFLFARRPLAIDDKAAEILARGGRLPSRGAAAAPEGGRGLERGGDRSRGARLRRRPRRQARHRSPSRCAPRRPAARPRPAFSTCWRCSAARRASAASPTRRRRLTAIAGRRRARRRRPVTSARHGVWVAALAPRLRKSARRRGIFRLPTRRGCGSPCRRPPGRSPADKSLTPPPERTDVDDRHAAASAGRRVLPNHWDLIALAAIMAVLAAIARAYHGISAPLPPAERAGGLARLLGCCPITRCARRCACSPRSSASFIFTFTYATLAAKSRRWEMVLIPLLDILQSVPILGFLSFTVTFFLGLFPGNVLGAECAAIFAIFTSQAWNMAFSFYQSLRTVPRDLDEVARGFRLTGWQKFWQLEAPFAVPGLIWNTMMSMSGGWFFVVAVRGDHRRRHHDHLARRRLLHRRGQRRGRLGRDLRGGGDDGRRHPALRSAAVPPDHRLGERNSASSCRSARRSSAPGCSTCCSAPTGSGCGFRPVFAGAALGRACWPLRLAAAPSRRGARARRGVLARARRRLVVVVAAVAI